MAEILCKSKEFGMMMRNRSAINDLMYVIHILSGIKFR